MWENFTEIARSFHLFSSNLYSANCWRRSVKTLLFLPRAIDDKLASAPWLSDRQLISQLPGVQPGAPDLSNMRGVSRHLRHVSWRVMSGVMTPRDGEMLHMVTASHALWRREADNKTCAIKPLMINTCRIAGLLKTKVAIFVFWDNSLLGDKINSEVTPDKLISGYTEGTVMFSLTYILQFLHHRY